MNINVKMSKSSLEDTIKEFMRPINAQASFYAHEYVRRQCEKAHYSNSSGGEIMLSDEDIYKALNLTA